MAKGGGGGVHPPTGFSNFSQKWESAHEKNFSNQTCHLGSKIRQREGAEGVATNPPPPPIEQKLTYFFNHEDDIQS